MVSKAHRRVILNKLEAIWEQYPERKLVSIIHQTEKRTLGIQWASDDQWIEAIQHEFPDRGYSERKAKK